VNPITLTFGKYEGEPLSAVALKDPGYLEWGADRLKSPKWRAAFEDALKNRPASARVGGEDIPADVYAAYWKQWQADAHSAREAPHEYYDDPLPDTFQEYVLRNWPRQKEILDHDREREARSQECLERWGTHFGKTAGEMKVAWEMWSDGDRRHLKFTDKEKKDKFISFAEEYDEIMNLYSDDFMDDVRLG